MKARIKFEKNGVMKYVGHLDIMRFFQKAMRRAQIPIRYSEGFNPHQIMSFASPLGVGITSSGEYMDVELKEEIDPDQAMETLNGTMVEGVRILDFFYLPDGYENAMSSVKAAAYRLNYKHPEQCPFSLQEMQEFLRDFYINPTEIMIVKKTKKGERELDLKPLIYRFEVKNDANENDANGTLFYELFVSTGSVDNIKPELVLFHFHQSIGLPAEEIDMFIHREDLYTLLDQEFVPLDHIRVTAEQQ